MPEWVNGGNVALTTFAAICFIAVWFVARLASGYLETWLGGRRADVSIKEATAGRIWADIEKAQPPAPQPTKLPTTVSTAPPINVVERRALQTIVGRCLDAGMTQAEIAGWLYATPQKGGNRTAAIISIQDFARQLGKKIDTTRQPRDRQWQIAQAAQRVTVNSARGQVILNADDYDVPTA